MRLTIAVLLGCFLLVQGADRRIRRIEPVAACFLGEYARWRRLEHVVLFDQASSTTIDLVKGLSRRGVFVDLQDMTDPMLPWSVKVPRHRLGAVVLLDAQVSAAHEEFLEQASVKQMFHAYVSWLFVTERSSQALDINSTIEERLSYFNIGPDTDLVVATYINNSTLRPRDNRRRNRTDTAEPAPNRGKRSVPNLLPNSTVANTDKAQRPKEAKNFNKLDEIGSCRENHNRREYSGIAYSLVQVYKIRPNNNASLVFIPLGSWNAMAGTANLVLPSSIEQRKDFRGLPLIVGVKNSSQSTDVRVGGGGLPKGTSMMSEDDMDEDNHLMGVLDFIARSLNASYELVPFTKLGWQNEEGAWLFLLGAVTTGSVDLGLDHVVITQERSNNMFFTLPIVQSMRNIYFRRPESSAMRDIFLAPFSPRLLASVAATGLVIATAMVLVNAATVRYEQRNRRQKQQELQTIVTKKKSFRMTLNVGEAMVWSVAVLCMQGSAWNPKSPSGCLVLIFSLCFALVIYNAYAAFITSVLSVRVASIKDIDDLLDSDFQFGYTLRGQDEAFLRTVNDTALRKLYFRGLVRNHGVGDASVGLRKASHGGYAFFVSARLGRKALSSFIAQGQRCAIQELTVEATRSAIALPMSNASPYRKLINLCLLRMREAGVLGPIQERMLPPMPPCQAYSAFNSASLTDVYSAFLVLGGGLATAICMGLSEKIWRRRKSLGNWMAVKWAQREKRESIISNQRDSIATQPRKRSRFRSEISWFD